MKCNEARNLVVAYLDSELDAKTAQEIQLHLQSCAECAELFAREEKFNEHMFRVLRAGQSTPGLWENVESRLRPGRNAGWLLRHWKRVALGGVSALILAGIAIFVTPRLAGSSLDLARAVAKDHREFVAGEMRSEFVGRVPNDIAQEFEGRLDIGAFSAQPAADGFRYEGARLCHLSGVPVAWTLGRIQQTPVSLVVFKRSELEHFPKAKERLESGEPVVCSKAGRYQFAVRYVNGYVVCLVGDLKRTELEALLQTVRPSAG
ncbi:MAG: zf-HC2 domain-containing protein [Verrucomicrobia subdivision 3 bacterium]|nr:zf-HC2 domain-containing protein [Limisphaerales bacterium]